MKWPNRAKCCKAILSLNNYVSGARRLRAVHYWALAQQSLRKAALNIIIIMTTKIGFACNDIAHCVTLTYCKFGLTYLSGLDKQSSKEGRDCSNGMKDTS